MNGGLSGFNNAQVTKALAIVCFTFSVFLGIRSSSSNIGLSYKDVIASPRILKLIASLFTFSSTPELMFGLYLMYYFRVFERQIGSNKYSVFILFSTAVSFLLEFFTLAYFRDATVTALSPGPYAVIFASFVPFFFDIPVSTIFRISGIKFSDKTFIYLAGFQLFLSSWKRSMIPALCGLIAGALYRVNLVNIRRAKFPNWITSLISRLSWPSNRSPRGISSVSHRDRSEERSQLIQPMEPPEDSIGTLEAMGFDRPSAREALVHARNDLSVATNILLEAQAHL